VKVGPPSRVPAEFASRIFNCSCSLSAVLAPSQRFDEFLSHEADVEFFQKALAGAMAHGLSLFLGEKKKLIKQARNAIEIVICYQAGAICCTSRQILTLFVVSAGLLQAMASAITMPKFSWCEGKMKASAARKAPQSARIVAFEPPPPPAETFRRLFAADKLTVLHEVAIAPVIGKATIQVSRRDDSSSLLPIAKLQTKHFPGTEAITTARVRTAPLTCSYGIRPRQSYRRILVTGVWVRRQLWL
jgi:hypothetical protein